MKNIFLLAADEVFITSSTRGLMPVNQVNDTKYGTDISHWPMTQKLIGLYEKKIQLEIKRQKYNYS